MFPFKGGYITRHYGRPDAGIDAVQLEIAQRTYMDEPGGSFDPLRAVPLQKQVRALIETALAV